MAAIFVIALLLFGPDQLPKVARQLGEAMRHMQNTTQTFMLEMDRAAREAEFKPNVEPDDLSDAHPSVSGAGEGQAKPEEPAAADHSKPPEGEIR